MANNLIAFLDESGIHANSRVLAVGGWVATPEEWNRLTKQWKNVLRDHRVQAFHFAACENGWGEFRGWSPSLKGRLITKAIGAINRRDLRGFCAAIVMPEYKETVAGSGSSLEEKERPYLVCLQYCVEMISKRVPGNVRYILDRQEEFDSYAIRAFGDIKRSHPDWAEKMLDITYAPKTKAIPLQAADLLVYETAKSLNNRLYDPLRPVRKSMLALARKPERLTGGYFDAHGSKQLLEWETLARVAVE